jgi:putative transposase
VVERTFAWLGRFRRLSKDYEFLPATSEAVIQLTMIQLLTRVDDDGADGHRHQVC